MKELERPLARPGTRLQRRNAIAKKIGLVLGVLALVGLVVSRLNLSRDLHHLDTRMLSGESDGNYFAVVGDLGRIAEKGKGRLENVPSNGSAENIARLGKAAAGSCDVQFGLAQDGADFTPGGPKLEVVARLWKAESVFFLGRDADKITEFSALAKMKIGIGPEGGGTARIVQQMLGLPELAPLGVQLSYHSQAEQLDLAATGQLDLAAVVMDEDAPFIVKAIHERGLQMASFAHLDVISRRLPHLKTGRIGAGQYDAVKVIPAEDKRVLRVETLVLTNGCASHSAIIDVMAVLWKRFPELVRHNKDTPNTTGLEMASAAKGFLDHDGPELADEFAPWLVDVMPPANWVYIVTGVSILFNAMNAGHRFRLWRIDDARVKLEHELSEFFGVRSTLGDITRSDPDPRHRTAEAHAEVDSLIHRFEELADRSRRQSLSMLVPMGQEMAYRYQEGVIYDTLAVLRAFRIRAAG